MLTNKIFNASALLRTWDEQQGDPTLSVFFAASLGCLGWLERK